MLLNFQVGGDFLFHFLVLISHSMLLWSKKILLFQSFETRWTFFCPVYGLFLYVFRMHLERMCILQMVLNISIRSSWLIMLQIVCVFYWSFTCSSISYWERCFKAGASLALENVDRAAFYSCRGCPCHYGICEWHFLEVWVGIYVENECQPGPW